MTNILSFPKGPNSKSLKYHSNFGNQVESFIFVLATSSPLLQRATKVIVYSVHTSYLPRKAGKFSQNIFFRKIFWSEFHD